eukprot:6462766-Amphidinium_carterae.2
MAPGSKFGEGDIILYVAYAASGRPQGQVLARVTKLLDVTPRGQGLDSGPRTGTHSSRRRIL